MPLRLWWDNSAPLAGAPGARVLIATQESWRQIAQDIAASGGRLLALWTSVGEAGNRTVRAAMLMQSGILVVSLPLASRDTRYPGLEDIFPAASRMQRAAADLTGIFSTDPDSRPWLRHMAWGRDFYPLEHTTSQAPLSPPPIDEYHFLRVEGDGVHEIAVGPVHAGIIEPGHFRFSVVGEKVLKLEERLGYVHKGIERRFTEMPLLEGHRLAARVSGDSAVAFSWAYCQALESMAGVTIPPRAQWLRALGLELERIANHLGDLGALGNDAGFAFGFTQFYRLKESLLRATEQALSQRYLMDFVVPGGIRAHLSASGAAALERELTGLMQELPKLRDIYDEHAGVRDRFAGTGVVSPELAARLGLIGLAGRASGQAFDLRVDLPCAPYGDLEMKKCVRVEGDVLARVAVRFDEVTGSCRIIQSLLRTLPSGPHTAPVPVPAAGALGVGIIEGWRGPVLLALEAGANGQIQRCHPHDPSWHNWPVLEHAVIGNIVPDFPLINKSFNLSYSGHDL